jgi:hypothetical protein
MKCDSTLSDYDPANPIRPKPITSELRENIENAFECAMKRLVEASFQVVDPKEAPHC